MKFKIGDEVYLKKGKKVLSSDMNTAIKNNTPFIITPTTSPNISNFPYTVKNLLTGKPLYHSVDDDELQLKRVTNWKKRFDDLQ